MILQSTKEVSFMELMPLRIPAGFAVCYNRFFDVDPEMPDDPDDIIKNWTYFTQDLLQIAKLEIKNGKHYIPDEYLLLDLGWSPDSDPAGCYHLQLVTVKEDHSWEEIKSLSSTDRFLIRDTLEAWMEERNNGW